MVLEYGPLVWALSAGGTCITQLASMMHSHYQLHISYTILTLFLRKTSRMVGIEAWKGRGLAYTRQNSVQFSNFKLTNLSIMFPTPLTIFKHSIEFILSLLRAFHSGYGY